MPAPVPPGYTRGPILFSGALVHPRNIDRILQSFWDEAGSYGSRIVIVPAATTDDELTDHYRRWFVEAEVDSVEVLRVSERRAGFDAGHIAAVENATGILIVEGSPLRFVGLLGGTPLAQAIRRANARGRTIFGVGAAGAVLCQHMVSFGASAVQFAPGLGVINRMALDGGAAEADAAYRAARLTAVVAYNPFLIGLALDPDTGAVVYPDSTLEVFGAGRGVIVDGWQITSTNVAERTDDTPVAVEGALAYELTHGYTYQLDHHALREPRATEIPETGYEKYSSF